jgi:hypothetical protein
MRIWFNRGFSLAAIAQAMMAGDPFLEVLVSVGEGQLVRPGPTETIVEPTLEAAEYFDWVSDQIISRGIDLFVPTHRRKLALAYQLPCRLHLPCSQDVDNVLQDKYLFATVIHDKVYHLPTFSVNSSSELKALLDNMGLQRSAQPCVKPRFGVNGHGFWQLTNDQRTDHLLDPEARKICSDIYLASLEREEQGGNRIQPLVGMDFLPGPEISFDVLADNGRILKSFSRTKDDTRPRQRLQSAHPLDSFVQEMVEQFTLHGVVNLQFRKARDGSWKVLEINTRPSGGSVYCDHFGGALLADWGGILTGRLAPHQIGQPELDIEFEIVSEIRTVRSQIAA